VKCKLNLEEEQRNWPIQTTASFRNQRYGG
jgi:hypothetical protein